MAAGYVDTNGVRLWYEELGRPDGAPVLLVMGGGASVVWWPPELLQGLVGAGYRVVQFDNRDVGRSSYVDWASAPYGIQDMAGDAMGVLDAVGIDAAHLVGVSVGGMICQAAALQYPDRVRSLTLISTTPGPDLASRRVTTRCSLGLTAQSRPMRTSPSWRLTSVVPWPGAGLRSMSSTTATSSPPISPGA